MLNMSFCPDNATVAEFSGSFAPYPFSALAGRHNDADVILPDAVGSQHLSPTPFNIDIARRAAKPSTHDRHACIRLLSAVSLSNRVKVGRGHLYTHVERAAP